MKTVILVVMLSVPLVACPKGMVDYEGNCADMPSPDTTTLAPMIGTMSDEKPPKDKMPSYERDGIKADTPPSLASDDAKQDQEKAQADAQGKKAAHVPQ